VSPDCRKEPSPLLLSGGKNDQLASSGPLKVMIEGPLKKDSKRALLVSGPRLDAEVKLVWEKRKWDKVSPRCVVTTKIPLRKSGKREVIWGREKTSGPKGIRTGGRGGPSGSKVPTSEDPLTSKTVFKVRLGKRSQSFPRVGSGSRARKFSDFCG